MRLTDAEMDELEHEVRHEARVARYVAWHRATYGCPPERDDDESVDEEGPQE